MLSRSTQFPLRSVRSSRCVPCAFLFIVFFGVALLPQSVFPDGFLSWEETVLDVPCDPGQEEIRVSFPYRNASGSTVKIGEITSSCGCTAPNVSRETLQPGDSGSVDVIFTVGDRVGPQRKTIRVETLQGDKTDLTTLVLSTDIPEIGSLKPRLLLWRTGGKLEEKRVRIHSAPGVTWQVGEPGEETLPFDWEVVEDPEDDSPVLVVKPVSLQNQVKIELPVIFNLEDRDGQVSKSLFLLIR